MSDAAVTIVVASLAQVFLGLFAFLGLWLRLRYGESKVDAVASKAASVEGKLDVNTELTKAGSAASAVSAQEARTAAAAVAEKADTIVSQTNGPVSALGGEVAQLNERVRELEAYNRDRTHKMFDVLHSMNLTLAKVSVRVGLPLPEAAPPEGRDAK